MAGQAKAKTKGISCTRTALAVGHRYRTLRLCGKRIPLHLRDLETTEKKSKAVRLDWELDPVSRFQVQRSDLSVTFSPPT